MQVLRRGGPKSFFYSWHRLLYHGGSRNVAKTPVTSCSGTGVRGGPSVPNATYFCGADARVRSGPLASNSDFVETSTSRARAPGAGQGTRPTDSMRKWKKYVAFLSVPATRPSKPCTSQMKNNNSRINFCQSQHASDQYDR
jgi:hypothetical protein